MIIAIDGPAGSGKSTVAKLLAKRLGFIYIDTGAMYRAVTFKVINDKIDIGNEEEISRLSKRLSIDLKDQDVGPVKVFLDGLDVTKEIRDPKITKSVSLVSKMPGVRSAMLKLQRKLGETNNSVLEGRDIGTVVFPNAQKKFFLDADINERVKRRFNELREQRSDITIKEVEEDLKNRDHIDSTRNIAPLRKADDAIFIDTTDLTIDQVVDKLYNLIKK